MMCYSNAMAASDIAMGSMAIAIATSGITMAI